MKRQNKLLIFLKDSLFSGHSTPTLDEAERLALLLMLVYSPLPPIATIEATGFEADEETLKAAQKDTVIGGRENLSSLLDNEINALRRSLELADYNISQAYSAVSSIATTVYAMIAAVILFVSPEIAKVLGYSIAAATIALSTLGLSVYPRAIALPSRKKHFLIPVVSIPLAALTDPLFALLVATIPSALLAFLERKEYITTFEEALERLRDAASRPWAPLSAVSVEWLRRQEGWILIDALKKLIELAGLHGAPEALTKALESYEKMYSYIESFSRKGLMMFAYTLIGAAVTATALALSLATVRLLSPHLQGFSTGFSFQVPSPKIRLHFMASLALISLGLALLTSWCREGTWRYYSMYLPFIVASCIVGWFVGDRAVVYLFGWGGRI